MERCKCNSIQRQNLREKQTGGREQKGQSNKESNEEKASSGNESA